MKDWIFLDKTIKIILTISCALRYTVMFLQKLIMYDVFRRIYCSYVCHTDAFPHDPVYAVSAAGQSEGWREKGRDTMDYPFVRAMHSCPYVCESGGCIRGSAAVPELN